MVASDWFDDAGRAAIAKAVGDAESKTAGEIVPVVATASENYERAEGLGGITLALAAVAVGWLAFQDVQPAEGDWKTGWHIRIDLIWVLGLVAAGYIAGSLGVRFAPALKRLLTGRNRMRAEVTRAAAAAFERFHVRGTKGATGIVIYVSLFEHMVAVLGDQAIAAKVDEAQWREICDAVVRGIREGRHVDGLVGGIGKCGELLAKHFPIEKGDVNELANELHVID